MSAHFATLTFDLTDPIGVSNHRRAVAANDLVNMLWDFDQELRADAKYRDDARAQEIRSALHEHLRDAGLSLDKLTE